jgi:hypothetical protein
MGPTFALGGEVYSPMGGPLKGDQKDIFLFKWKKKY